MLYEVVLRSTYFGQECINRWNYVSSGSQTGVLGSFALATEMGFIPSGDPAVFPTPTLFSRIRAIQSIAVNYQSVTVRAASDYDPTDFYEVAFANDVLGLATGEALSPVMAFGFRSSLARTDIARGTKRFTGVPEPAVDSGGGIASGFIAGLGYVSTEMAKALSYTQGGADIGFVPAIVSKEEYETPRGKRAYRYYATLVEQLDHVATGISWQAYDQVRTQNSRQYGRGI